MNQTEITTRTTKVKNDIYGSFTIGRAEFALEVEFLQEVVHFPSNIVSMPLAPKFLIGIFNLRGTIIPIIDVRKILSFEDDSQLSQQKVAIIGAQNIKIGLLFDSTGEILRIGEKERSHFAYGEGSTHKVIKGALKIGESGRLLQILDPLALFTIENIPQINSDRALKGNDEVKRKLDNNQRKKCISFKVEKNILAFEINKIHEIIRVPEIQHSALESELCLGNINLRGQLIPLISFSYLMNGHQSKIINNSDQRIIILKMADLFFGLLIDSILSIDAYQLDQLMTVPLLSKARLGMFQGCIPLPNWGETLLIDENKIFSDQEIEHITKGHCKLYSDKSIPKGSFAKEKAGQKEVFITFQLKHLFGLPITEIKEIIECPSEIIATPGMPKFVSGIIHLRDKIVTIIDGRRVYQMEQDSSITHESQKILIFQKGEENYGLVVDSIEGIIFVDNQNRINLPQLLATGAESLNQDVKEVFRLKNPNGEQITVITLQTESLFKRIFI